MRRGFTLIELLVVISIIAILIGILLPALGAARNRAKQVQCSTNIRSVMGATAQYSLENNEYLPFPNSEGRETGATPLWSGGGWLYTWSQTGQNRSAFDPDDVKTGVIWYYLDSQPAYRCPMDPWDINTTGDARAMTSYMMNASVRGFVNGVVANYRISQFRSTDVSFWEPKDGGDWNDGNTEPQNGRTNRHLDGVTVAFFDGHAEFWSNDRFDEAEDESTKATPLWCDPQHAIGGERPSP